MATPEEEALVEEGALAEEEAAAEAEAETLAVAEAAEEEEAAAQLAEEDEARAKADAEALAAGTPKKGSFQDRINAITHKFRSAERELDYYKNIVLGKKQSGDEVFKPTPAAVKKETGTPGAVRPRPVDFETVEDYEDALYGWYDSKKMSKDATTKDANDFKELLSAFNKGAASLRREHPDFDEVTGRPVFTDSMRRVIFNLNDGALVAYELGNNPELAEKIKVLSPDKQMYELSKLEHKLVVIRKVKKGSKTPDPLHPITGRTKKDIDPNEMSIDDWMAREKKLRMAKIKKSLGIKD